MEFFDHALFCVREILVQARQRTPRLRRAFVASTPADLAASIRSFALATSMVSPRPDAVTGNLEQRTFTCYLKW
ncbi:MAG TPA: hypothetical protein VG105_05535 [Paraburkholderia sp.]|jgi:hypothetical protein|nr:hypothetical protein [Paraburkholderia sp.]